jgi:hypothetical protein
MRIYYPDRHSFDHWAIAPWPEWSTVTPQTSMQILETWLNSRIGSHYELWAWHEHDHRYWEACVAFRWPKHRTLFLLQWT